MIIIVEAANQNKNSKYIELAKEVKQKNKECLEENNNILSFITENYEMAQDEKDKIKSL